ncbi:ABC transporter ATP-binding protein [Streptomyces indicus]|uniref:ABC-type quaternary amine transporter n=1 Tax=Streptomyces indicus TaxID=417292 RepID=A0A1G8TRJ2_9ACTN|nr:betaine/proline/choline family ABC transporter ATP-binding protein [Streptomyces indicus]SDJ44148.1 osmoprotectant transport system ATP-binding protein [Streptomyces indicus]
MIRFERVTKRYADGTTAVDDLSFEVAEGELVTLVGPSGCGKTTTMMMINRLIEPTEGKIFVDGEDISQVDPVQLRRRIGYVIQQVGLFPHRTILDNTATVPALVGWKRAKAKARAAELLDMVGLDPKKYGSRYPDQLSGGQRQRVGVARALAADPPVLLMDEPFGAVDPVVREQLQDQFLEMQASVRKTVVMVTHDIEEAVRLGDRIAVYGQGRIEQFDSPGAVLGNPATPYVAEFVGADRGLKRLSVTRIEADDLEEPPLARLDESAAAAAARLRAQGARWAVCLDEDGDLHGWAGVDELALAGDAQVGELAHRMNSWVPVGAPLKTAFGVMLQHDAGWVAVLDGARFLGVLTPAKLHEALRRSVDADALGVSRDQVEFDSVSDA